MDAARVLRQARLRRGLSQRELARLAGVSQPTVARIESGSVVPRVDTLDRLLEPCGEALEAVPRMGSGVDRSLIREMLKMSHEDRAALAGERMRREIRASRSSR